MTRRAQIILLTLGLIAGFGLLNFTTLGVKARAHSAALAEQMNWRPGVAAALFTANSRAGVPYMITAGAAGLTTATFSPTTPPGPATHFTVTAPPSVTAGQAFSITVTAKDQFDNTATSYTGTVQFTKT